MKAAIFDLGNVVLLFSHERMCRQLAEVFGMAPEAVRREIFETDFVSRYDRGLETTEEMFRRLAAAGSRRPTLAQARMAAADIFEVNRPVLPILEALRRGGVPLVVLSNTCEVHASHVRSSYDVLGLFDALVLSHEVGMTKPDPRIYDLAADAAGCAPGDCFFTDDVPDYVAAARRRGLDAETFTDAGSLARALAERGLPS